LIIYLTIIICSDVPQKLGLLPKLIDPVRDVHTKNRIDIRSSASATTAVEKSAITFTGTDPLNLKFDVKQWCVVMPLHAKSSVLIFEKRRRAQKLDHFIAMTNLPLPTSGKYVRAFLCSEDFEKVCSKIFVCVLQLIVL
jgi:hypothetical protein